MSLNRQHGTAWVLHNALSGPLAEKTDRSPSKLAQEPVAQGLDDVSDGLVALERMDNPEGWYSLEDLEEGRDLEG